MRNIVFIVIAFVLSFSGRVCAGNPVYSDNSLRNDAEKLLVEWVDALLAYHAKGCIRRSTAVFCVPPVPAFTDG